MTTENKKEELQIILDVDQVNFDMLMSYIEIDVSIQINGLDFSINGIYVRKTTDSLIIKFPDCCGPKGNREAIIFHDYDISKTIQNKIRQFIEENEFVKSFINQYYF